MSNTEELILTVLLFLYFLMEVLIHSYINVGVFFPFKPYEDLFWCKLLVIEVFTMFVRAYKL